MAALQRTNAALIYREQKAHPCVIHSLLFPLVVFLVSSEKQMFSGYQSGGTRGSHLLAGAESVKIHSEYIPCKVRIEVLDGLSGHRDYVDIEQWLSTSKLQRTTPIKLVQGEPDAADSMRVYLKDSSQFNVTVAEYRTIVKV